MEQVTIAVENLIKGVRKHGESWIKYEEASKAACGAAQNTLNLFECCVKSDIEGTSLGEIVPSIRSKLIVKLIKNINPSLIVLRKNLDGLRRCQNRIMSCVSSFEIVLKDASLYNCAKVSSKSPPATQILESVGALTDMMFQVVTHRETVLSSIEKNMCTAEISGKHIEMQLNWNTNTILTDLLDEILASALEPALCG